jgi:hypothetical protein
MAVHHARDLDGKPSEPGLENLRTFWQMTDRRKKSITCALYRTIGGLELRAGHGEGDRLLCQRVYTELAAEVFAAAWKAAAEAKGFRES